VAASECIFCKIAAGTAECHELYRDETTLAFMDIHPANEGHCLVIPQAHFATVFQMPPQGFAAVGATVAKLARAVNETLQPGGLSLVQANGEVAGQTVSHVHVHVLPRRAGDNLLLNWIVIALAILCMPIPLISLLLPGASASGWRVPTRGSSEAGFESRACFAVRNVRKAPPERGSSLGA
jgi:histidine triad (HIT) family protein